MNDAAPRRSLSKRIAVVLGLVAALAASCTDGGTVVGPSPSPLPTGEPTATETSAAMITQSNFAFTPKKLTIESGETLTVVNSSAQAPHTFTVTGEDIDVVNDVRQTKTVTIELEPGTYRFVCTFHEDQGMRGTLVVR